MNYSAIVLAAGSGTRMNLGYNKMLIKINEQPLITLSLKHFINDGNCTEIIIVVNEKEQKEIKKLLNEYNFYTKKCEIVCGSNERQYSVYNGLQKVTNDLVLIHDGARPFITQDLINHLIQEAKDFGCAIPGVKVKDTIKFVENNVVKDTLPREYLYAVQTPQACQSKLIKNAHEQAKKDYFLGTDEGSLIEKYTNYPVRIVLSSYENIKITTQDDLDYANRLYPKYFK